MSYTQDYFDKGHLPKKYLNPKEKCYSKIILEFSDDNPLDLLKVMFIDIQKCLGIDVDDPKNKIFSGYYDSKEKPKKTYTCTTENFADIYRYSAKWTPLESKSFLKSSATVTFVYKEVSITVHQGWRTPNLDPSVYGSDFCIEIVFSEVECSDNLISMLKNHGFIFKVLDNFSIPHYVRSLNEMFIGPFDKPDPKTVYEVSIPKKYKEKIKLFENLQYNLLSTSVQFADYDDRKCIHIRYDFEDDPNMAEFLIKMTKISEDASYALIYHGRIAQKNTRNLMIFDTPLGANARGYEYPAIQSYIQESKNPIKYIKENIIEMINDQSIILTDDFLIAFSEEYVDLIFDTVEQKKEFLERLPSNLEIYSYDEQRDGK